MINYNEFDDPENPFFAFILENAKEDCNELLLKYHNKDLPFSLNFAVCQIVSRRKTTHKLPSFLSFRQFIFPDSISSEQASDERVAEYHAALVGSGHKVLDMTAGLGIDAMTIAIHGNNVIACDIDHNKCDALVHNSRILNIKSLLPECTDSVSLIKNSKTHFDCIFIDPARRDENNRRTYSFSDCTPNVIDILPDMLEKADRIFIKSSPLLDLSQIRREINYVSCIHIVCVKGECKEVLVDICKTSLFGGVRVIDFDDSGIISDIFFTPEELEKSHPPFISSQDLVVGNYLYEPNAGLMKLRSFKAICDKFPGLKRVSNNTSLYISSKLYSDFPGRILEIESFPGKLELKNMKGGRYNVVIKNYPLDAKTLRNKLKLEEGTDKFLYAFKAFDNKNIICVASRM